MTAPIPAGGHAADTVEKAARAMSFVNPYGRHPTLKELAAAALSVVPAPDDGLRDRVLDVVAAMEAEPTKDSSGLVLARFADRLRAAAGAPTGSEADEVAAHRADMERSARAAGLELS